MPGLAKQVFFILYTIRSFQVRQDQTCSFLC
jgi:hypothetical protein